MVVQRLRPAATKHACGATKKRQEGVYFSIFVQKVAEMVARNLEMEVECCLFCVVVGLVWVVRRFGELVACFGWFGASVFVGVVGSSLVCVRCVGSLQFSN